MIILQERVIIHQDTIIRNEMVMAILLEKRIRLETDTQNTHPEALIRLEMCIHQETLTRQGFLIHQEMFIHPGIHITLSLQELPTDHPIRGKLND